MGMSASQARLLSLQARQSNLEYQGQQINQARTALANQSAELWNQMLGLSVPTVPDQTNYTRTQYSFTDGQNSYEIFDMVPSDEEDGYNYTVKYRYYEDTVNGIEVANTNPQVRATVNSTNYPYTDDVKKNPGKDFILYKYVYNTDNKTYYQLKISDAGAGTYSNFGDKTEDIKYRQITKETDAKLWEKLSGAGLVPVGTDIMYSYTINGETYYTDKDEAKKISAPGNKKEIKK